MTDTPIVQSNYEHRREEHGRILLVDDDGINLLTISRLFKKNGYEVVTTSSADKALNVLESEIFDLAVLDVMMPNFSGIELCAKIRSKFTLFQLPVLFLTALSKIDDLVAALKAGGNDFVSKPPNSEELLARVKNLLMLKKMTDTNHRLREVLELKDSLFRIVAHDIKNPLNSILQASSLLQDEVGKNVECKKRIDHIKQSSSRVLQLISDFLRVEELESRAYQLRRVPVELDLLLLEVLQRYHSEAQRKGQSFKYHLPQETSCRVQGDPQLLHEVLDNLVSNAVKYSRLNTDIEVALACVSRESKQRVVRVSVKDQGPGLLDDELGHLFKRYKRLSARPTGGESSTGLGLSIVKEIASMHDAQVWVDTEKDRGSTFHFEIAADH